MIEKGRKSLLENYKVWLDVFLRKKNECNVLVRIELIGLKIGLL